MARSIFWIIIAAALLSRTAGLTAEPPVDIFIRQARLQPNDTGEQLLLDAIFGKAGAVDALRDWLERTKEEATNAEAWSFLCSDSFQRGDYSAALADCSRAVAADPKNLRGGKSTLDLAKILKDAPPPSLTGTGARLGFNPQGHIEVVAGDEQLAAVVDTGAQVSLMMQSVAEKAGVHFLGEWNNVETATRAVAGKAGTIPRVRLGQAELRDLPVLVMPDRTLTFENGKFQVRCILGLGALRQFGRVAWLEHGKVLALGDAAPTLSAKTVPAYWHPLGIGIPINGPGGDRRGAHYDTGSNRTYLYATALPIVSKAELAKLKSAHRKIGGVGGIVTERVQRLPKLTLQFAHQSIKLFNVDVAPTTKTGDAARIGADIFKQLRTVVLDLNAMRLSADR